MSLPNELLPVGLLGTGAAGGAGYEIERSLRFNSSDSAYLSRTPTSAGNRRTWTWAGWVKRSELGSVRYIFSAPSSSGDAIRFGDVSDDKLFVGFFAPATSAYTSIVTAAEYRDPSAWLHIVVATDTTQATDSDRIKLYVNGSQVTAFSSATYPAQNAEGRINTADLHRLGRPGTDTVAGYLSDFHFIDGQALDPSSFGEFDTNGVWQPKAYEGNYGTNGFHLPFSDNSTAAALGTDTSGNGNDWTPNNLSVTTFTAASWTYSATGGIVNQGNITDNSLSTFAYSATAGSSEGAVSLSVNTSGAPIVVPSGQNLVVYVNSGTGAGQRKVRVNGGAYVNCDANAKCTFPGPLTVTSIDSTLGPNVGGGFSATIAGIELNGILLVSGDTTDSLVDSPTNYGTDTGAGGEVRGNYATLNPLATGDNITLSNGNLQSSEATVAGHTWTKTTIGMKSGKWYAEITVDSASGVNAIGLTNYPSKHTGWIGADGSAVDQFNMIYYNGSIRQIFDANVVTSNSIPGGQWSVSDVLQIAYDADAGKAWFGINNTWYQANGTSTTVSAVEAGNNATFVNFQYNSEYFFTTDNHDAGFTYNFGQRPFAYTAPSGFKALCTTNLPEPTIADGSTAMDVALYTGNSSTQTISGLNFSPDLVWIKSRGAARNHRLTDSIRGATKALKSDATDAEATNSNGLVAFNSDGFDLSTAAAYNSSGFAYVAWTWDAGSSTVTNTQGSITSQVRANASAGFSVVTFTAPASGVYSFGHGLGVAPRMVIMKDRGVGGTLWCVYHASVTSNDQALGLNLTAANSSYPGIWGAGVTSTVVGSTANMGIVPNSTAVAYCFAPVAGYSSFGSYTGNGSADGPFVYNNFLPKLILIKRTDTTSNWTMLDTSREGYNVDNDPLYPNLSNVEGTTDLLDINSNGFKLRTTDASVNANTGTYVYAAWASNPFQYSRAR